MKEVVCSMVSDRLILVLDYQALHWYPGFRNFS